MSRRPKPTEVKQKQGNPGRRPLNTSSPVFDGTASAPKWMDGFARTEWKRIHPQLKANKMITKADRSALVGYCLAFSLARRAHEYLLGEESLHVETAQGGQKQRPEVATLLSALDSCRKFMIEFGMTPAARARITLGDLGATSKTSEFLFGDDPPEGADPEENVTEFPKSG
jgi:P27 family predicted phage terminase small subunit